MTNETRMLKLLTASPKMLAKVDQLLSGDESHTQSAIPDMRTCTLTEASRWLRVSRPTVYRLIKRGILRTVNLNGHPRVLVQSLADYTSGTPVDTIAQGV